MRTEPLDIDSAAPLSTLIAPPVILDDEPALMLTLPPICTELPPSNNIEPPSFTAKDSPPSIATSPPDDCIRMLPDLSLPLPLFKSNAPPTLPAPA